MGKVKPKSKKEVAAEVKVDLTFFEKCLLPGGELGQTKMSFLH